MSRAHELTLDNRAALAPLASPPQVATVQFKNHMSHAQFQEFVKQQLIKLFFAKEIISIVRLAPFIARLFLLNLDPLRELLIPTYRQPNHQPTDPVALFRSLLIMTMVKETSVTKWVERLKDNKIYAILSGFEPAELPGVGTFYDFLARLVFADREEKRRQRHRRKKFRRKPAKRLKKNEKLPPKHPHIVNRVVDRIIRNLGQPPSLGKYRILYQFFIYCIVKHSAELGVLGDLKNLTVSGDGTHIQSGASSYGRKVCHCPKFVVKDGKKVFNHCDCTRRFSDGDATWGWDSYREQYVYGYVFYEITAADSPFDLPLLFLQAQAQRHDSVLAPIAFDLARKLLGEQYHLTKFLADSAHDNLATYKLMHQLACEPFIPLNEKNKGHFTYEPCPINEQGVPLCHCGEPMIHNGYCPDRMRIKWRCPLKADKNFTPKSECVEKNCGSASVYGRVVYTYPEKNLRLFTKTPRGSESWLAVYDQRTASERSFKRKKCDFRIEQGRVRSREQWFIRFTLAAICQHLDAWAKTSKLNFKELCKTWQAEALATETEK
jgi:hypothetical protein